MGAENEDKKVAPKSNAGGKSAEDAKGKNGKTGEENADEEEVETEEGDEEEGEEGGDGEPADEDEADEDPVSLKKKLLAAKKHNKDLKAENTQRRLKNRELRAAVEEKKNKGKGEQETIESLKAAHNAKLRNTMLRAELASVASDANDHQLLFTALGKDLDDVDVDVESDDVDRPELERLVEKMREKKPFLFKAKEAAGEERSFKKGSPLPKDGNGRPKGGKNELAVWKQLKDAGRGSEAQEYYNKNRAAILAQQ